MKKFITLAAVIFSVLISLNGFSQPLSQHAAFDNPMIQSQADSVRSVYENQGFTLAKSSGMNMESEYEVPVILPLKEGTWYRIVFIGEYTSKLYEVRMFDWNEKQIVYKKQMWGDVDGNIIAYDYIPKFTEYHMVKPVQINKKKKQCGGYFMIFKKLITDK